MNSTIAWIVGAIIVVLAGVGVYMAVAPKSGPVTSDTKESGAMMDDKKTDVMPATTSGDAMMQDKSGDAMMEDSAQQ